jgi:hypothetical protein
MLMVWGVLPTVPTVLSHSASETYVVEVVWCGWSVLLGRLLGILLDS